VPWEAASTTSPRGKVSYFRKLVAKNETASDALLNFKTNPDAVATTALAQRWTLEPVATRASTVVLELTRNSENRFD
jgi:hypothetical protein